MSLFPTRFTGARLPALALLPVLPCAMFACTGSKALDSAHDSAVDSASDADTDADADADTDADTAESYNGTIPPNSIPAPEFTDTDMDGTPRTRVDLIGHPTVIWFYPAATSSG